MLLCFKSGLGIEWYDWGLFFFVFFAALLNHIAEQLKKNLPSLDQRGEKLSYFDDLKSDKEEKK